MRQVEVRIPAGLAPLYGALTVPPQARGLVLFVHGSGSGRHSPRNRRVAATLQEGGLATLLFDLLTLDEEDEDKFTGHLRFDIELLAARLMAATRWVQTHEQTRSLRLGYFGASTGAAAALVAAATNETEIGAIVSRGGRPDLAAEALRLVQAPTLLIVGGADDAVISLNESAAAQLRCVKRLEIIPGATHLFDEPGALAIVAELAVQWFKTYLTPGGP